MINNIIIVYDNHRTVVCRLLAREKMQQSMNDNSYRLLEVILSLNMKRYAFYSPLTSTSFYIPLARVYLMV
jgi:hypothetical protein